MKIPKNSFGLCAHGHDVPVKGFVFDVVLDAFDFGTMHELACRFVREHGGVRSVSEPETGFQYEVGSETINVIVNGNMVLATELISACVELHTDLVLWHYDRNTGKYHQQRFWFFV